ncbi:MAG: ribbon-helix-helix protein, CopG family [Myxococcota bacterium]|nr:ribbon-helix-helix protein, CopG family [Myxococcota bacterium]
MQPAEVMLEDWEMEALRAAAKRQGKSVSALLREILSAHLASHRPDATRGKLASIAGIIEDDEATGRDHDSWLYGRAPRD